MYLSAIVSPATEATASRARPFTAVLTAAFTTACMADSTEVWAAACTEACMGGNRPSEMATAFLIDFILIISYNGIGATSRE